MVFQQGFVLQASFQQAPAQQTVPAKLNSTSHCSADISPTISRPSQLKGDRKQKTYADHAIYDVDKDAGAHSFGELNGQRTSWSPPDATLSPALLDSSGSLFPTPKHNTEQALHLANTTSQAIHHTDTTAQAMQPSAAAAATAAAGEELRIAFSNVEDKAIHLGI
ncbi:hypothetical protein D6D24_10691 [Aureobasidium pullulans]|uniref:Uncharacterized protein n=1 Tax=Aureobasidium pullulans TaxID=5580 RepID=A0A4S8UY95_AURPU|nr:hypothetical protein D6D24_10691 [Aureobasidium pullulans]THZ91056.1 hypothetical protein D6C88_03778 [Aureobasidium pullulans]